MPGYFAQLEQAVAAGNREVVTRQTHTLKGLTAQVGGMKLSARMKALDDHLKGGGTVDNDNVIDLRREYQLLSDALGRWMASIVKTAPAPAGKPLALDQVVALYRELDALLSLNQFDAVGRFAVLQETVAGTEVAAEVAQAGRLIAECRFALAREHLQRIAVQQGWESKT
jgi:HPt (histidine-containing phosphotransfer) domain-containing protein